MCGSLVRQAKEKAALRVGLVAHPVRQRHRGCQDFQEHLYQLAAQRANLLEQALAIAMALEVALPLKKALPIGLAQVSARGLFRQVAERVMMVPSRLPVFAHHSL